MGSPYVGGPHITGNNNLFFGHGSSPAGFTASINKDPGFANAAQKDFRLTAASPARNAGSESGLPSANEGAGRSWADLGALPFIDSIKGPGESGKGK